MQTPKATRRLDIRETGWSALDAIDDAEAETIARLRANRVATEALPSLRRLVGLRYLHIAQCGLRAFPARDHLPDTLEELSAAGNFVPSVPEWLPELTRLKTLNLSDNPLSGPVFEILARCPSLEHVQLDRGVLTIEQVRALHGRLELVLTEPKKRASATAQASWGALFAFGEQEAVTEALVGAYESAGARHVETLRFADAEGTFDEDALFGAPASADALGDDEVLVNGGPQGLVWAVLSRRLEHAAPAEHPLARAMSARVPIVAVRAVKGGAVTAHHHAEGDARSVADLRALGLSFDLQDLRDFDARAEPRGDVHRTQLGFEQGSLVCWEEAPETLFVFRAAARVGE